MAERAARADLVEIIRRSNNAWDRRDVDAWLSLLSPDVVYRPVPTFTDSQERQGLGAMRRFLEEWHEAWADDWTTHVESTREYGDDVVIALLRFKGHARASGVKVEGGVFQVCRFREGKIASMDDFTDRADALKAAGVED